MKTNWLITMVAASVAVILLAGCEDGGGDRDGGGATYTTADLAGTWNYVMRETGSGVVYEQGTITFDAAGNLTAWTEADFTSETGSGPLSVDSAGTITGVLNVQFIGTLGDPTTGIWSWQGNFTSANHIEATVSADLIAQINDGRWTGTATIRYERTATLTR